eukprot:COSAG01_NODE_7177_length_3317_cov_167.285270_4_plen_63_part_00
MAKPRRRRAGGRGGIRGIRRAPAGRPAVPSAQVRRAVPQHTARHSAAGRRGAAGGCQHTRQA